ncbi:MAG: amidophosphoribosyltransferase [Eubacteriaceae bacterium]
MIEKLNEECAVFGVCIHKENASGMVYNGLLALQHRGQEGAGIATLKGNTISVHKNRGLVSEVFTKKILKSLLGTKIAIGHTRYSTTGDNLMENVQPFITEYLTGRIATAHNGNITNSKTIRNFLEKCGLDFEATSDSEVISSLIAYEILQKNDVLEGVINATKQLEGSFSLILLSSDQKLIVVRDPHGFRPLCIGENENGLAVASESCALESCGFNFVRDVTPGEVVVIENGKMIESRKVLFSKEKGSCIFEYVYFARPDSIIDGLNVDEARINMGKALAWEHPVEADVVCGVPDSGLEAALGYSKASGIPLTSGFFKNRYIGRSFIFPEQAERESAVRLKMNPLRSNVEGKRVVLVDDSIVRGTTSGRIIKALRNAGAKEVHLRISSPPFRYPCYYGTDIDSKENLIANKMTVPEISKIIGADSLGYISIEGLVKACSKSSLPFCTGCFNEIYGMKKDEGN